MTHVFLTGATGYVVGDVLYALEHSNLSGLEITCLVRDEDKAQKVQAAHPSAKIVLGTLDDFALVAHEAQCADVVLHLAATRHAVSASAIAKGLAARQAESKKPGYWIQISGASLYAAEEIASSNFGRATNVVYDDMKDQDKILSLVRGNPMCVVENTVLSQSPSAIRTALIPAPLIYGCGRGPVNQCSVQAPEIARSTLKLGHGFELYDGENVWSNVHVQDVASLIVLLVSAAVEGKDGIWNGNGIYNVENGQLSFGQLGMFITKEAQSQGLIKASAPFKTIDATVADCLTAHGAILWGTNARTKASKARHNLGWVPTGPSLQNTIPDIVRREAGNL